MRLSTSSCRIGLSLTRGDRHLSAESDGLFSCPGRSWNYGIKDRRRATGTVCEALHHRRHPPACSPDFLRGERVINSISSQGSSIWIYRSILQSQKASLHIRTMSVQKLLKLKKSFSRVSARSRQNQITLYEKLRRIALKSLIEQIVNKYGERMEANRLLKADDCSFSSIMLWIF